MVGIGESHRDTRDNLGTQDENKNLLLFGPYTETLGTEMGPTQMTNSDIGDAFVLGHATNGIIGPTGKNLGNENFGAATVIRVVNPNNTFHEHYRFSNFDDTTKTTGVFSTSFFNVSMDNNELWQSLDIFKNILSVQSATVFVDLTGGATIIAVDDGGGQTVTITEGQ